MNYDRREQRRTTECCYVAPETKHAEAQSIHSLQLKQSRGKERMTKAEKERLQKWANETRKERKK
ncbi:MAG TPA: hypothetical protein VNX68_06510 [Nitrosopumilaceae archaeon]|jgi:hypothetical protein|nr:hypothetical protein [Nitrosopumilaceae archaeon]